MRFQERRKITLAWIGAVLVIAGCATTMIKLPARDFIKTYIAQRDQFRDDTYPARAKCAKERQTLSAVKQLKCDELKERMEAWAKQDEAVLTAVLEGNAVDLGAVWAVLQPILKLALDIAV